MKLKILAATAALSLSGLASAGAITAGGPISSASTAIPLAGLMERLNRQARIVGNTLSEPIVIDNPPAATLAALRPDGVAPGAALSAPPGSSRAPVLRLRALGVQGRVRWLVNGRLAGESEGGRWWRHRFDRPGRQRVTALADSGAWDELELRVLR